MPHRFFIADVFTDRPFAGNQLAVFPNAEGLSDRAMQAAVPARTRAVELPGVMILEEGIGPVPVEIAARGLDLYAHLIIEKQVEVPPQKPAAAAAAAALSLPERAVLDTWFASAGVPFCFVKLADRETVDRAVLDRAAWSSGLAQANLYFFAGDDRLYVRMFAPALGVEEDPATGSGAVALAGVLAARLRAGSGTFAWRIDQGVAMGRPSRIEASAEKHGGQVVRIKVGGATVITAEGSMSAPNGY